VLDYLTPLKERMNSLDSEADLQKLLEEISGEKRQEDKLMDPVSVANSTPEVQQKTVRYPLAEHVAIMSDF
jgi:benzoyl-CoA reductase/2-hydroxyglutaryl-CoA dehydratase subunit BcrC/BadD/HgdB